jgi:putative glutamine amidotransferase
MKNLFVVGGSNGYANWVLPLGFQITQNADEADLFLFTGGEDVNPALYNQPVGRSTYFTNRDVLEKKYFEYALNANKPMMGVCRGLQFLTVMAGGKLIQDMNHPGYHEFVANTGERMYINSLHHQMALVDPSVTKLVDGEDYELIAWTERLSKYHLDGHDLNYGFPGDFKEPEVLFFPKIKAWGVQGHPEMLFNGSRGGMEFKDTISFLQNSLTNCLNLK